MFYNNPYLHAPTYNFLPFQIPSVLRLTVLAFLFILCTGVRAQEDLYTMDHIVEVELEMHDPYWKKKLNAWKKQNLGERILATLKVDGVRYDSVGVRLKGNSSYFSPARAEKKKLPFNIKVSHTDKEQMVQGKYRTLKLSNVFRDPSFVREALSYQIARDYLAAPHCNFARLTVDGDYFGLYNLTESVDEHFWETAFDSPEGLLVKCDPESKEDPPATCPPGFGANLAYLGQDSACYAARYELKKTKTGWDELIALTEVVSDEDADLSTVMNVDETLWMLAFNNALANLDSYLGAFCHNYYLFKDESGVWRPVIWDLNLSMGGFRIMDRKKVLTDAQLLALSPFTHFSTPNPDRPLITRLFNRPLYRKMYVAHLHTIYREQFASGLYAERAKAIRDVITPLVIQEPNPLYPTETYTQNYHGTVDISGGEVVGIEEFFKKRGAYLAKHPLFAETPPEITDHAATLSGDTVTVSVTLGAGATTKGVWVAHRGAAAGGFTYTKLTAEADGNYVVSLPAGEVDHYYLIAEGNISATVLPERSARAWFVVDK